MTRVTFGVTCAPYLANRCLKQLEEEDEVEFPAAAKVLKEEFLVDNLLSGAPDLPTALKLHAEVVELTRRGQLQLRKWASNHIGIVDNVPRDHRDSQVSLLIDDSEIVKAIGLLWQPTLDVFGVTIVTPDLSLSSSKRRVLSSIARIFDPLGWLSPVTIRPKTLIQKLWKEKLDWDSPLPPHLHKEWINYCKELVVLKDFHIDRCILRPPESSCPVARYELHGFCDASQLAYAACVYIKVLDVDGCSRVNLVVAKTKVAPVKTETIPRLELCGAVLLTKLMKVMQTSIKVQFGVLRFWTDSTTVLDWLGSKEKLPVFVANRTRKIQRVFPRKYWLHIPGAENPADAPSRGITASSLVGNELWLNGPPRLTQNVFPLDPVEDTQKNKSSTAHAVAMGGGHISLYISMCTSYWKTKRVVAYCKRFLHNCRHKHEKKIGFLRVAELKGSLISIVSCIQAEAFPEELEKCRRQQHVKSKIKCLAPFLDKDGILRVGGRLHQSSASYDRKHPMILPRHHKFTDEVARHYHLSHLHAGPQLLLAAIRDQFWIVRGADVAKQTVRKCLDCHSQNPATVTQLMGQLPAARVKPSRPFLQSGLDYAGPFKLCLRSGRNPLIVKSYVCLFVCMATKAIHLEWASDLTTPAFVACITRFISRRGLPSDIFCDGGLNFQGAKNEMTEFIRFVQSNPHNEAVSCFLGDKGINYHFKPPFRPTPWWTLGSRG